MVWPTLGSRTAKEQEQEHMYDKSKEAYKPKKPSSISPAGFIPDYQFQKVFYVTLGNNFFVVTCERQTDRQTPGLS